MLLSIKWLSLYHVCGIQDLHGSEGEEEEEGGGVGEK